MTENEALIGTRVIVSCDASPLGATAIDAAAALARELHAELLGLFVEDINLIRTAALPFSQEVASSTAQARRMHAEALQGLLTRQAASALEVLREAASALRLRWSFQVVRGAPLNSVLNAMRELDLAVFGHTGRFSASHASAARAPVRQPVMVMFDGTPAALRALDAAAALAKETHSQLVVVLMDTTDAESGMRAQALQRIERRHQSLAVHQRVLFQTLKRRDAQTVGRVVERHAPAVLLWGGVDGHADRATLATLVDALKCPVVLVG